MQNFHPHDDYRAGIRCARQLLHVLLGGADGKAFHARDYAAAFLLAQRLSLPAKLAESAD